MDVTAPSRIKIVTQATNTKLPGSHWEVREAQAIFGCCHGAVNVYLQKPFG